VHSITGNESFPLLHVDDSANERFLVKRAIFVTKTPFALYGAAGLESAIPYFQCHLHQPEKFPRPAMVLLDYEMGDHTGADFLYWLRAMKKITSIPVVLFSGSVGNRHVASCYATGANYFISKPKDSQRLKEIVQALYHSLLSQRPGPILLLDEYQQDPRQHPTKVAAV
jgi:CheY-like chemotaxis protein